MISNKRCCRCKQTKPIDDFGKDKSRPDGLFHYCKICSGLASAEHRKRNMARDAVEIPEYATCSICKETKRSDLFQRDSGLKNGLSNRCKECNHRKNVRYYSKIENTDKITPEYKLCSKCGFTRPAQDFYKNSQSLDGLATHCKICYAEYENSELGRVKRLRYLRGTGKIRNQESWQRYYSRIKQVEHDFDERNWLYCLEWWDGKCAYCGSEFDTFTRDHFIPVSSFGNYTVGNIVPACSKCNPSKGKHNPYEWCHTEQLNKIHKYFSDAISNRESREKYS